MTPRPDIARLEAAAANSPGAADGDIAEDLDAVSAEITALRRTVAELTATNERQAAQLEELAGPAEWLALRACDAGRYSSEAVRTWCETGKVVARRDGNGSRWFVNTRSLAAHLKRLGLAKAIKSGVAAR
jgi:hypothetical protein